MRVSSQKETQCEFAMSHTTHGVSSPRIQLWSHTSN